MSIAADRRQRLLRLRALEQRVSTARLAQAAHAHDSVKAVGQRVAALRAGVFVAAGPTDGRALQSQCELAARLDEAQRGVVRSIGDAARVRDAREAECFAARIAADRVARLHARECRREDDERELRLAAARPSTRRQGGRGAP